MFFYPHARDLNDARTTLTAWTYDANGNRLSEKGTTTTFAGSYDAQDKLLTYGNGTTTSTFVYNANGERIRRIDVTASTSSTQSTTSTTLYAYDVQGNLTSATLPSGERIEYVYDAFGRRIARKKFDAAGAQISIQRFLYSGLASDERPIAMLDADGNVLQEYTYFTKSHVPDIVTISGTDYRVISDERGTVRSLTSGYGSSYHHYYWYYDLRAQALTWDEWGNCLSDTNPGFQPFGFAGSFYDPDLNLHHLGAREYDPTVGRWLQPDPLGLEGGLNLYAYCANDPINKIDPSGLEKIIIDFFGPEFIPGTTVLDSQSALARARYNVPTGDRNFHFGDRDTFLSKMPEIASTFDPGDVVDVHAHGKPGTAGFGPEVSGCEGPKLLDYEEIAKQKPLVMKKGVTINFCACEFSLAADDTKRAQLMKPWSNYFGGNMVTGWNVDVRSWTGTWWWGSHQYGYTPEKGVFKIQ